jgi:ribosome modulation factor
MEPHWNLWLHLFKAEHFAKKAGKQGVQRAVHAGSCTLQVQVGRGEQYILAQLISSNSDWHDGWFYLRNDDDQLLRFSGRVLMSREDNWTYDIIKEDKPKLQPLLDALSRLQQRGLTAGMVAATFHRQRVLSLMQRRLQIDEMTSEASLEGSRMSHESLPLDEVTRRAQWMVGSFKQEDIDRVPTRPTQGFEPLVSVVLDSLGSFCFPIPSTQLVEASV